MPSLLIAAAEAWEQSGISLEATGLAWARTAPLVALVPAFGLRAIPVPARAFFGLALAMTLAPAVAAETASFRSAGVPWPALVVGEALRGLPVAVATAVPLWAATMTGGLVDALRGSQDSMSSPTVEGRATVLGVPFALLASAIFFAVAGPAKAVAALSFDPLEAHPALFAARSLASGISLAVALGAPMLAASFVVEVALALAARSAAPAQVHALLAPLRTLALVAMTGIALDGLMRVLASVMAGQP